MSIMKTSLLELNDKSYVLTGSNALYMCGLSTAGFSIIEALTNANELKGIAIYPFIIYYYVEDTIDECNYLMKYKQNSKVLIPTQERALIENIRYNLDFVDEGCFCEAMESYKTYSKGSLEKLYEVADFYGVNRDTVKFWWDDCDGSIQ